MNELFRRILWLPVQGSTVAGEVDALHYAVITITMIGATGVFAAALYFTWRYRRTDEAALTPPIRAPLLLELAVVGGLLCLFLLFWRVGFQQYLRLQSPPADAIEIYVTGKKWMWKFAYPGGQRTNARLVVPAGRPVKLIMTSRDVIHSFYVPAFRIKQDVLPGRYTTAWFEVVRPGVYPLFCAEYCGTGHSEMKAEVVALSGADWEAWIAGAEEESMAAQGLEVAARRGCLSCHTLDGQRHVGPSFRGLYGGVRQLIDGEAIADEAYLTRSMMEPAAQVVAGYAPVMPTYLGQLDAGEVAALVELIKSLRHPNPPPPGVDYPPIAPAAPTEAAP